MGPATRAPSRVRFTPDIAVMDGQAQVTRAATFDRIEHRFTYILTRHGGRWLIAHVRAYVFA